MLFDELNFIRKSRSFEECQVKIGNELNHNLLTIIIFNPPQKFSNNLSPLKRGERTIRIAKIIYEKRI